jgi:hypothetical protein
MAFSHGLFYLDVDVQCAINYRLRIFILYAWGGGGFQTRLEVV